MDSQIATEKPSLLLQEQIACLGLNKRNEECLLLLIESTQDYVCFMSKFWRGRNSDMSAISKFRIHKMGQCSISYVLFKEIYNENPEKALQKLFMHPVCKSDVEWLKKKMDHEGVTLADVYDKCKEYPETHLLRLF